MERCVIHGVWQKPQHSGRRFCCSLTPGAASLSPCLPKTFQESRKWMSALRSNKIAELSFTFGKKAKILSKVLVLHDPSFKTHLISCFPLSLSFGILASFSSSSQQALLSEMFNSRSFLITLWSITSSGMSILTLLSRSIPLFQIL